MDASITNGFASRCDVPAMPKLLRIPSDHNELEKECSTLNEKENGIGDAMFKSNDIRSLTESNQENIVLRNELDCSNVRFKDITSKTQHLMSDIVESNFQDQSETSNHSSEDERSLSASMETDSAAAGSSPKAYLCNICDRSFTMRRLYDRHMLMHANGLANNANSDFYTWGETNLIGIPGTKDSAPTLLFQESDTNEVSEYRCFLCDRVFSTIKGMKGHMTRMHSDDRLAGIDMPITNGNGSMAAIALCDMCGDFFNSKEMLMTHLVEVHGTTIVKPEPVVEVMTNGQTVHMQSPSKDTPFLTFNNSAGGIDLDESAANAEHHCCLCNRDFVSAHALNLHVSQFHGSGAPPIETLANGDCDLSKGSAPQLILPIVTKRPLDEDDVDEDEEDDMITEQKMISSIKQEVVQNVKSEIFDSSTSLQILRPGEGAGGIVISNVFSLNSKLSETRPVQVSVPVVQEIPPVSEPSVSNIGPIRRRSRVNDGADYVHLCRFCGKGYAHPSNKFRHQRVCHMREAVEAANAAAGGSSSPLYSQAPASCNATFECGVCHSRFGNRLGLTVHAKKMHAGDPRADEMTPPLVRERRFVCCDCGARYAMMCNLCCHRKRSCPFRDEVLEAAEGYNCFTCKEHFTSVTTYLQHGLDEPSHGRINQQPAMQEQQEQQQQHLEQMQNIQVLPQTRRLKTVENVNEDRPWPCTPCGKFYRTKADLNDHRLTVHGLGPYLLGAPGVFFCPVCDRQFRYKHHMSRHIRAAHADKDGDSLPTQVAPQPPIIAAAMPPTSIALTAPISATSNSLTSLPPSTSGTVLSITTTAPSVSASGTSPASGLTPIVTISTSPSASMNNVKGLSCEDCGIAFSTRRLLMRHLERVHKMTLNSPAAPSTSQAHAQEPPQLQQQQPQQQRQQSAQNSLPTELALPPNLPDNLVLPSLLPDMGDDCSTIWINGQQAFLCNRDDCRRVFSTKNGLSVHLYRAHIRPALEQQQAGQGENRASSPPPLSVPITLTGSDEEQDEYEAPLLDAPSGPEMMSPVRPTLPPLSSIFAPLSTISSASSMAGQQTPQTAVASSATATTSTSAAGTQVTQIGANVSRIKILPRPAGLTKAQVHSSWEDVLVTNGTRCEICNVTFPSPHVLQWHKSQHELNSFSIAPAPSFGSTSGTVITIKQPVDDLEEEQMECIVEDDGADEDNDEGESSQEISEGVTEILLNSTQQSGLDNKASTTTKANTVAESRKSAVAESPGKYYETLPRRAAALARLNRRSSPCAYCGKTFRSDPGLKVHLTRMHTEGVEPGSPENKLPNPLHACPKCPLKFAVAADLRAHEVVVHTVSPDEVADARDASDSVPADASAAVPVPSLSADVDLDNNSAEEPVALRRSRRETTSRHSGHRCTTCNRGFANLIGLKVHMKKMHNQSLVEGVKNESPVISSQKNNTQRLSLTCPYCSKEYDSPLGLKVHLGRAHSTAEESVKATKPSWRQPSSGAQAPPSASAPAPALPFTCCVCNRVFRNQMSLSTHQRSHGGRAPSRVYGCERCLQRFTKWCNMIGHQKTCCPVKLGLYCPFCDERFDVGLDMYAHISSLHSEKEGGVCCPKCSERFDSPTKVREHLSLVHVPLEDSLESSYGVSTSAPALPPKPPPPPVATAATHAPSAPAAIRVPSTAPPTFTSSKPSSARGKYYEFDEESQQYACKLCSRLFPSPRAAVGHQRLHRGGHMEWLDSIIEEVVSTPYVSTAPSEPVDDSEEIDDFTPEEPDSTEKEREEVEVESTKKVERPAVSDNLPCRVCKRLFKNARALYAHQRTHGLPARRFICSGCGRSFGSKSALGTHQSWYCLANAQRSTEKRTEEEKKRAILGFVYGCHVCGKMFRWERRLLEHKRAVHSNFVKPIKKEVQNLMAEKQTPAVTVEATVEDA